MKKWILVILVSIGLVSGIGFARWAMWRNINSLPPICVSLMAPMKWLIAAILHILPLHQAGLLIVIPFMYVYWACLGALFGFLLYQCFQLLMFTVRKLRRHDAA